MNWKMRKDYLSVMPLLMPNQKKMENYCAWPMLWKEEITDNDECVLH